MTIDAEGNESKGEISVEDQLRSVTALLGAVLLTIDEPVHIAKELLARGPAGRIVVDDNLQTEEYVLYVEVEE